MNAFTQIYVSISPEYFATIHPSPRNFSPSMQLFPLLQKKLSLRSSSSSPTNLHNSTPPPLLRKTRCRPPASISHSTCSAPSQVFATIIITRNSRKKATTFTPNHIRESAKQVRFYSGRLQHSAGAFLLFCAHHLWRRSPDRTTFQAPEPVPTCTTLEIGAHSPSRWRGSSGVNYAASPPKGGGIKFATAWQGEISACSWLGARRTAYAIRNDPLWKELKATRMIAASRRSLIRAKNALESWFSTSRNLGIQVSAGSTRDRVYWLVRPVEQVPQVKCGQQPLMHVLCTVGTAYTSASSDHFAAIYLPLLWLKNGTETVSGSSRLTLSLNFQW